MDLLTVRRVLCAGTIQKRLDELGSGIRRAAAMRSICGRRSRITR